MSRVRKPFTITEVLLVLGLVIFVLASSVAPFLVTRGPSAKAQCDAIGGSYEFDIIGFWGCRTKPVSAPKPSKP